MCVTGQVRHILLRRPAAVVRPDVGESCVGLIQDHGQRVELSFEPDTRGRRDGHSSLVFGGPPPPPSVAGSYRSVRQYPTGGVLKEA
jgi:hypothetical protein